MRQSNRSKQLKSRRLLLLNTLGLHDSQRYLYTWCWFQLSLRLFPLTAIMFVSSVDRSSFHREKIIQSLSLTVSSCVFRWHIHCQQYTKTGCQYFFIFIYDFSYCFLEILIRNETQILRTGVSSCYMDYLKMLDIHGFGITTLIINLNSVFVWLVSNSDKQRRIFFSRFCSSN